MGGNFNFSKKLCEMEGGKWGSTCIKRSCYLDGSCGERAYPSAGCDGLYSKAPRSEVYFQLGMPERIEGSTVYWNYGKAEIGKVAVKFEKDKLVSLDCKEIQIKKDIHK